MKRIKGTFFVEDYYLNDKIFCEILNEQKQYSLSKYIAVKEEFKKSNIELHTQDILPESDSDFTIYLDFLKPPKAKKSYLIVREPLIIIPDNHDPIKLKCFSKVFTWNDELIDNVLFVKYYNQSYDFKKVEMINHLHKKEGYVLICSNKVSNRFGENYSLRDKVINFFENKNYNFDFYGIGWTERKFSSRLIEAFFNRLKIKRPKNKNYNNYRGIVDNKRVMSSKYSFEFAIENTNNIKGYVTEKIFDAFFSKTIPLYSGAPNIYDYIPRECFINIDEFASIEELVSYTKSLTTKEVNSYGRARDLFLSSPQINIFSSSYNAKIITSEIINDF